MRRGKRSSAIMRRVVMLIAVFTILGALSATPYSPRKVEGAFACYGIITYETYYSDGTYSTVVGTCTEDECAGTYRCSGQQTDYVLSNSHPKLCSPCSQLCGTYAGPGGCN